VPSNITHQAWPTPTSHCLHRMTFSSQCCFLSPCTNNLQLWDTWLGRWSMISHTLKKLNFRALIEARESAAPTPQELNHVYTHVNIYIFFIDTQIAFQRHLLKFRRLLTFLTLKRTVEVGALISVLYWSYTLTDTI
jgi:hypothetical protein